PARRCRAGSSWAGRRGSWRCRPRSRPGRTRSTWRPCAPRSCWLTAVAPAAALATSHALGQPRADLGAVLGGHDVLVLADVVGGAPGGQLVLALGLGDDVAVPELDGLQDHAHRDLQLDLGVLLGRDHLLHAEDQVAGGDPGLDQV